MARQGCFKQDDPEYAVPLRDVAYDARSRNMAKPLPDRALREEARSASRVGLISLDHAPALDLADHHFLAVIASWLSWLNGLL